MSLGCVLVDSSIYWWMAGKNGKEQVLLAKTVMTRGWWQMAGPHSWDSDKQNCSYLSHN